MPKFIEISLSETAIEDRILILCRRPGIAADSLATAFAGLGRVEIVADSPAEDAVWVPDKEMPGFEGLSSFSPNGVRIGAWERAWRHLEQTPADACGGVWFVEEDVAGSAESFARLMRRSREVDADLSAWDVRTRDHDPHWPHWHHGENFFAKPSRSFNPLCRLSGKLVREILDFRRKHGRFVFLEVLFASMMAEKNLSYLDWRADEVSASWFGSYQYRPEVISVMPGICHPVKDAKVHESICEWNPVEMDRLGNEEDSAAGKQVLLADEGCHFEHFLGRLETFLRSLGLRVDRHHIHSDRDYSKERLRKYSRVYVWNGSRDMDRPLVKACAQAGVEVHYIECGWFPQKEFFYVDTNGVNAVSALALHDDLSWVTSEHIVRKNEFASHYFNGRKWTGAGGYIFVPLQLPWDSQVKEFSEFEAMPQFMAWVIETFPHEKIVFRKHPLDRNDYGPGVTCSGDLHGWIAGAKLVYGLNSTVLLEAELMGATVVGVGTGFLNRAPALREKLMAAMVARQIPIDETNLRPWMEPHLGLDLRRLVPALYNLRDEEIPKPRIPSILGGHCRTTHVDRGVLEFLVGRFEVTSALDLGCGPGGTLEIFRDLGIAALGIDADPSLVAPPGCEISRHDFHDGVPVTGIFDLGWMVECLEHIAEFCLPYVFETLRRCRVVFITSSEGNIPRHLNPQKPDYWIERFEREGFQLDSTTTDLAREASTMEREFSRKTGLVFVRGTDRAAAEPIEKQKEEEEVPNPTLPEPGSEKRPVNRIISLGSRCNIASHLRRAKLTDALFPFDWIISDDTQGVVKAIENRFSDFFLPRNLSVHPFHKPFVEDMKYGLVDSHSFSKNGTLAMEAPLVHEKYARAAERFGEALDSGDHCYLLRQGSQYWGAKAIAGAVQTAYPNARFTIVSLTDAERDDLTFDEPGLVSYKIPYCANFRQGDQKWNSDWDALFVWLEQRECLYYPG